MATGDEGAVVIVAIECLYDFEAGILLRFTPPAVPPTGEERGRDYPFLPVHWFCNSQSKKRVRTAYAEDGFFFSLAPREGALAALHSMQAYGLDVRILISATAGHIATVTDQLRWVEAKLGRNWTDRVVLSKDKSLIQGRFLIDSHPRPESQVDKLYPSIGDKRTGPTTPIISSPSWEHVVFDAPYNRGGGLRMKKRMVEWKSWKEVLGLGKLVTFENDQGRFSLDVSALPFFRHGSENSLDVDTLYLFPSMPDSKVCERFIAGTSDDRNIFTVTRWPLPRGSDKEQEDRCMVVRNCDQGYPDEINNALIATYSFHPQTHPLPLAGPVTRIVATKLIGATRWILLKLIRMPHYRSIIKNCVRNYDFNVLREALAKVDFTTTQGQNEHQPFTSSNEDARCESERDDPNAERKSRRRNQPDTQAQSPSTKIKETLTIDDYKYIAFQFGQTLALIQGHDLYTKNSVAAEFPQLAPFLRREKQAILASLDVLNQMRDRLLDELRDLAVISRGELNLFSWHPSHGQSNEHDRSTSQLNNQSRGLIVDALKGRVSCFPMTQFMGEGAIWPTDDRCHKQRLQRTKERYPQVSQLVSIFKHEGRVMFASETDFDGADVERVQSLLRERWEGQLDPFIRLLDLENYWYILQAASTTRQDDGWELCLVGMRHRYAMCLLPIERLAEEAQTLRLALVV